MSGENITHGAPELPIIFAAINQTNYLQAKQYQILKLVYFFTNNYTQPEKLTPGYIAFLNTQIFENWQHSERNNIQKIYHIFILGREMLMAHCIAQLQNIVTTAPVDLNLLDHLLHRAHYISILLQASQDDIFEDSIHMCNFFMIAIDIGYHQILQQLIALGVKFSGTEAEVIDHKLKDMQPYIEDKIYQELRLILDNKQPGPTISIVDVKMYLAKQPGPIGLIKDIDPRRRFVENTLEPVSEIVALENLHAQRDISVDCHPTANAEEEEEVYQKRDTATTVENSKKKKQLYTTEDLKKFIYDLNPEGLNRLLTHNPELKPQVAEYLISRLPVDTSHTTPQITEQQRRTATKKNAPPSLFFARETYDNIRRERQVARMQAKLGENRRKQKELQLKSEQEARAKAQAEPTKNSITFIKKACLSWYDLLLILMHQNIVHPIRNAALREALELPNEEFKYIRHFCELERACIPLADDDAERQELLAKIETRKAELKTWLDNNPHQALDQNLSLYNFFASEILIYEQQFILAFPFYSNELLPPEILSGQRICNIGFSVNEQAQNFMHMLARGCPTQEMFVRLLRHIAQHDPNGIITSTLLTRDLSGCTVIKILETEKTYPWIEAINAIFDMFRRIISRMAERDKTDFKGSNGTTYNQCMLVQAFYGRTDLFGNNLKLNSILELFAAQKYLELIQIIEIRETFREYLAQEIPQLAKELGEVYREYFRLLFGENEYCIKVNASTTQCQSGSESEIFLLSAIIVNASNNANVRKRLEGSIPFRAAFGKISPVEVPNFQRIPLLIQQGEEVSDESIRQMFDEMRTVEVNIDKPNSQGFTYLDLCITAQSLELLKKVCEVMGAKITPRNLYHALGMPKNNMYTYLYQRYIELSSNEDKAKESLVTWQYADGMDLVSQAVARSPAIYPLTILIDIGAPLDKVYTNEQNLFNILCLRLALAKDEHEAICCGGMLLILTKHIKNDDQLTQLLQAQNRFGFSAIEFIDVTKLNPIIKERFSDDRYRTAVKHSPAEAQKFLQICKHGILDAKALIREAIESFSADLLLQILHAAPEHTAISEGIIVDTVNNSSENDLRANHDFFIKVNMSYMTVATLLRIEHLPANVKGCLLANAHRKFCNYSLFMFTLIVDLERMIECRRADVDAEGSPFEHLALPDRQDSNYNNTTRGNEERQLLNEIENRIKSVNRCTATHERILKEINAILDKFVGAEELDPHVFTELLKYTKYRTLNGANLLTIAFRRRDLSSCLYAELIDQVACDITEVDDRRISCLQALAMNFDSSAAQVLELLWERVICFQLMAWQKDYKVLEIETALTTDAVENSWLSSLFSGTDTDPELILDTLKKLANPKHTARSLLFSLFIQNCIGESAWSRLEAKRDLKWLDILKYVQKIFPQLAVEFSQFLPQVEERFPDKGVFFKPIDFVKYPIDTLERASQIISIISDRNQIRESLVIEIEKSNLEQERVEWLKSFFLANDELTHSLEGVTLYEHLQQAIAGDPVLTTQLEALNQQTEKRKSHSLKM